MQPIDPFDKKLPVFEQAEMHVLYRSDFYRILDFKCRCKDCNTSRPEYTNSFAISFVRKGNFLFNVFRHSLDSYSGCMIVTKPGTERTVSHVNALPDECTIFEFRSDMYEKVREQYPQVRFLTEVDLHSTLVKINPETEYLHFQIIKLILTNEGSRLEIDGLVMDLIATAFSNITDYVPDLVVNDKLKKNHLITIERAKNYITEHFADNISLEELASHCFVSPFHFSRIFKSLTQHTPHQFLLNVRLKKAEIMLRNTSVPVMEIAFSAGFNSVEHFTAAFTNKHRCPPAKYRTSHLPQILTAMGAK